MRQINIIYSMCAQNRLRYNNGVTIYLYVGLCSILPFEVPNKYQYLPPSSLVYPNVFFLSILLSYSLLFSLLLSSSLKCPTPCTLTFASSNPHLCFFLQSFFCGLAIITFPIYPHIPMLTIIQRDSHEFREFPWNLFQTLDGVREWLPSKTTCSRVPILLGLCLIQTCFVVGLHSANLLGTPWVLLPQPLIHSQSQAHYDKPQGYPPPLPHVSGLHCLMDLRLHVGPYLGGLTWFLGSSSPTYSILKSLSFGVLDDFLNGLMIKLPLLPTPLCS